MIRAVVALAVVAACHDPAPPPPAPSPAPEPAAPPAQVVITGIADDWSSTKATLRMWQKIGEEPWQPLGDAWLAVLGRNGLAFAAEKREGDGKSPAGKFPLLAAYGYATNAPPGTKLPYRASEHLECVDDPASPHYNQIVDGTGPRDWSSSEQMRRADALYTYVIEIAHNAQHTPKGGSCIFFHVWGGPDTTTSGCTAMPEDKLVALLRAVDHDTTYVLLPRAEYARLAEAQDLPPATSP